MNKVFYYSLAIIFSIIIIIAIYINVFNLDNKVNKGKFNITSIAISNKIIVDDSDEINDGNMHNIKFDLSSKSNIFMNIKKNADYDKIYIDNVKIKNPKLLGKISYKEKYSQNNETDIYIYKDEYIYVDIEISNEKFKTSKTANFNDENTVIYDGTILKYFNITDKDINFNIRFNLNILEKNGNLNVCKFNLDLITDKLTNYGIEVKTLDEEDFNFVVK